ncbi:hypothetical protein [Dermacoccus nishinomiyaensis]|uniref:hypothetical protein n=1 Tax=Dermacoccus nishinomiyaensis TaxID=1274 RepID=UPI00248ED1E2|nr:hypothetical protein [Dermacoccus nishinomiyaensis]
MSTALQPCLACGELSDQPRCEQHRATASQRRTLTFRQRGYDAQWDRVSREARRRQPWCSDCGGDGDLTADHTPEAWRRKAQGLAVRVEDVEVVCGPCNVRRGSSRPGSARATT